MKKKNITALFICMLLLVMFASSVNAIYFNDNKATGNDEVDVSKGSGNSNNLKSGTTYTAKSNGTTTQSLQGTVTVYDKEGNASQVKFDFPLVNSDGQVASTTFASGYNEIQEYNPYDSPKIAEYGEGRNLSEAQILQIAERQIRSNFGDTPETDEMVNSLRSGRMDISQLKVNTEVSVPMSGTGAYIMGDDGVKTYLSDASIDLEYDANGKPTGDLAAMMKPGAKIYHEGGKVYIQGDKFNNILSKCEQTGFSNSPFDPPKPPPDDPDDPDDGGGGGGGDPTDPITPPDPNLPPDPHDPSNGTTSYAKVVFSPPTFGWVNYPFTVTASVSGVMKNPCGYGLANHVCHDLCPACPGHSYCPGHSSCSGHRDAKGYYYSCSGCYTSYCSGGCRTEYCSKCCKDIPCINPHYHPDYGIATMVWAPVPGSQTFAVSTEGVYNFSATFEFEEAGLEPSIENAVPESPVNPGPISGSGGPYKLDMTPPVITITAVEADSGKNVLNGPYTNSDVNYNVTVTDALSGVAGTSVSVISDRGYSAMGASGTLKETGVFIINASATDVAGNSASATAKVYIDKICPVIEYALPTDKYKWNPARNRWEIEKSNAGFYVRITDEGGSLLKQAKSGIGRESLAGSSNLEVDLTSQIQAMENGEFIFIPFDTPSSINHKKYGGLVYLAAYGKDGADNEAVTANNIKLGKDGDLVGRNTPNEAVIIPGSNSPYTKQTDDFCPKRTVPGCEVFIDTGDTNGGRTSALYITKVYDTKWSKSLGHEVGNEDFALLRNKQNDTIGLGYRVDFRYDTVGYGIDNGDTTIIDVSLYGKVGTTYKKITNVLIPPTKTSPATKDVTNEYSKIILKRGNNVIANEAAAANIQLKDYKFLISGEKAKTYFNYYIPANAEFKINGQEYNGNDIVVRFDTVSYKFYDLGANGMPISRPVVDYHFNTDADISWAREGSRKVSYYGEAFTAPYGQVPKCQTFWYDVKNTALDDISGSSTQN